MPASKALKHKEENRYRFLTFSERLAQISVNAVHRIARTSEEVGDDVSRFHETLMKWRDEDRSLPFREFYDEVEKKSKNYRMILHYRAEIAESLQRHLAKPDSLALQSLCELLVSLCMDLRSELYPFFPNIFQIMMKLLATKNLERVELIFNAISLLFKYLWRYMVDDIKNILQMYSHLICGEHPPHISSFAAESISFLLRKIPLENGVYQYLFHILQDKERAQEGTAKVIFYVLKSTKGKFHSCCTKVLPNILLNITKQEDASAEFGFECLNIVVKLLAEHAEKEHALPVWDVLLRCLQDQLDQKELCANSVDRLLKLCNIWCGYKNGMLIINPVALMNLTRIIMDYESLLAIPNNLLEFCDTLMLCHESDFELPLKENLLKKIISVEHLSWSSVLKFWRSIFSFIKSNAFAQDAYLKYCQKWLQFEDYQARVVTMLAEYIVSEFEQLKDGKDVCSFLAAELNFAAISRKKGQVTIERVLKDILQDDDAPYSDLWCSLLVIQHMKTSPAGINEILITLFKRMSGIINNSQKNSQKILAVVRMTVQTVVRLEKNKSKKVLEGIIEPGFVQNMLKNHSEDQNALFLVDILMSFHSRSIDRLKKNPKLLSPLYLNLSTHDAIVRKLSLRILSEIHAENNIFQSCLKVEQTPATVHDYRTKVLHLNKLKNSPDMDSEVSCAVLRFLVSNFYINFSLYWPCVQDAISSFMPDKKDDPLWLQLFSLLEEASKNSLASRWWTGQSENKASQNETVDTSVDSSVLFETNALTISNTTESNCRIDFFNHRLQFWKTIPKIPQLAIVEGYNRKIVGIFFEYLEKEHYKVDRLHAPWQNICVQSENSSSEKSGSFRKRDALKTLEAFLNVFARFNNPIACAETKRLRSLYEDMLMHDDGTIQICALKCVLSFRENGIVRFKEPLLALLDDDKIKEAMINLKLSEIKEEDRKSLIPMLLRLMYGRMTSKSGLGAQGRSQVHNRRSIVLRFLSGLTETEMQSFIFLAIDPLRHNIIEEDLHKAINESNTLDIDPSKIVPLSRQHGILNTVMEIINNNANLLSKFMFDYLLKFLLTLHHSYSKFIGLLANDTGNVSICEDEPDVCVDQRFSAYLRSLSKLVHSAINTLVDAWPSEEIYTREQIESIFFVLVDPHIHKLKHECISQPNSLLHLFEKLSQQPKFVPLLAHKIAQQNNEAESAESSPIQAIIVVLCSGKTSLSVCRFILNMILRLVCDEEDEDVAPDKLVCATLKNIKSDIIDTQNIDHDKVGVYIVNNFVKEIMDYFIKIMKDKKVRFTVVQSQLKVMGALSAYITDKDMSFQLAELLFSNICGMVKLGNLNKDKAITNEKCLVPALTTLCTVACHTKFIPTIARLFSHLQSRESRLILVDILDKACGESPCNNLQKMTSIVQRMNAWDKKFVEELDYDSRLSAFQDFTDWLENENAVNLLDNDCIALLPALHSSIFTLFHHYKDISLRESATLSLELIINLVFSNLNGKYSGCYHAVIKGVMLPAIQIGIKSEDEALRYECVRLMVKIAKLSPSNSNLHELTFLCNESDPDADFYENIQHIQLHRRTRAFKKLSQMILSSKDLNNNSAEKSAGTKRESLSYKTVLNYLLPLAMQTLKWQDLSKHQHLQDACLEVVASTALLMPWSSYLKLLLQNMAIITKQSFGVHIVCAILQSFHFNIEHVSENQTKQTTSLDLNNSSNRLEEDDNECSREELEMIEKNEETAAIYQSVISDILPRLCNQISGKLESDSEHKLANSNQYTDIEASKMRAPIAIAVASLLRKLPDFLMRSYLPRVILKLTGFLRHRYSEVRSVASRAIVEICKLLGPTQLHVILKELRSGLMRGYQKHVLIHTVNSILDVVAADLKVGDLEKSLSLILNLLSSDMFGESEAERNVSKIQTKTPEARGRSKAYNIYRIVSKFVGKTSLLLIISPLKNVLDTTHDHKKRRIVEEILVEVTRGLQENSGLTVEDTLTFLHGLLTENLSNLFTSNESKNGKKKKDKKESLRPKSCFLLSTEPEKYGIKPTKKTHKTNLHLLIEFALQYLNNSLKREVVFTSNQEHLQMLDPFVDILKHCLFSAHSKTVTESMRCLTRLFRSQLPSMELMSTDIAKILFTTLRENSSGSVNDEMAAVTFKALSVFCLSELGAKLTDTQLHVLLAYSEEVLYEKHRQSHAFNLIKSILSRGLKCNEIVDVMKKIRDICIQSHDNAAMIHARQVYIYFLINYSMPRNKHAEHLEFILAQLSYQYESGRLSSLEILASLINSFSQDILQLNAGTIFLPVVTILVNDDSMKCRKLSAHVIKMLLMKLPLEDKDQLFSFILNWYGEENRLHQQLAAMLVTLFVEVEEMDFHRRLQKLVPLMMEAITEAVELQSSDEMIADDNCNTDYYIFHNLSAFHSVINHCKLAKNLSWSNQFTALFNIVENLLLHPHTWVRIISSQIFGTVFGSWEPSELVQKTMKAKQEETFEYFMTDLDMRMKELSMKFCKQIQSPVLDPKLAEQSIKNLLFIVKVQYFMYENNKIVPAKKGNKKSNDRETATQNSSSDLDEFEDDETEVKKDGITRLLLRLRAIAIREAAYNIKETNKRNAILKFCAAVCVSLSDVSKYLELLIDPVYREVERTIVLEDEIANALKVLAMEVLEVIKSKVGAKSFTKAYAAVGKLITGVRRERKRKLAVELVADPARAASVKIRRQQKRKEQRKRKIASIRPGYEMLKRKKKMN